MSAHKQIIQHISQVINCQNPTQLNSTQRNFKATSVGVRHSSHVFPTPPPHHPTHPTQTFQTLLDQLESCNLAQTLTRPI